MKLNLLVLLLVLLFTQLLIGQKVNTDSITSYVTAINADSTLQKVDSSYFVFGNKIMIEGFFLNNNLVKIRRSNVHLSVFQSEFYIKKGVVVYVRKYQQRFSSTEPEYERFYYFYKNKLIKKTGTGKHDGESIPELKKWITTEIKTYEPILYAKYKLHQDSSKVK